MCSMSRVSASSAIGVPVAGLLGQQRADRVAQLVPAAVGHGDVDQHPVQVGGVLVGRLQAARPTRSAAGRGRRPGAPASAGWRPGRRPSARSPRAAARAPRPRSAAKLSVDSTQSVTTGMPISSHHSTNSLSLSAPGLVARHQRLARRVGPGPAAVAVGQHGDVPGQPVVVELGDQPVLVGRVEQPGRVQPVHELAQPVKSGHGWQRSPASGELCRGRIASAYAEPTVP